MSLKKPYKFLINSLIPEYIRDQYPKYVTFVEQYLGACEEKKGPFGALLELPKLIDISVVDQDEYYHYFSKDISNTYVLYLDERNITKKSIILKNGNLIIFKDDGNGNLLSREGTHIGTVDYIAGELAFTCTNLQEENKVFYTIKNEDKLTHFIEQYISSFPYELLNSDINNNLEYPIDIRKFIENAKTFYSHKGNEQSFRFVFNLLGGTINFFYPHNFIFESSKSNSILSGEPIEKEEKEGLHYIHDNHYWAYYVYEIQTDIDVGIYEDIVRRTVHPAGFKLFSKKVIELIDSDGNIIFNDLNYNNDFNIFMESIVNVRPLGLLTDVAKTEINAGFIELTIGSIGQIQTFEVGEIITGSISGTIGTIVHIDEVNFKLYLNNVSDSIFEISEIITGNINGLGTIYNIKLPNLSDFLSGQIEWYNNYELYIQDYTHKISDYLLSYYINNWGELFEYTLWDFYYLNEVPLINNGTEINNIDRVNIQRASEISKLYIFFTSDNEKLKTSENEYLLIYE